MLGIFRRNREENKKRTETGVEPSRGRWFGRILNVLRSCRLDDSVWEELEEILISSDVGVETSLRIIDEMKDRVRDEKLEDAGSGVSGPEGSVDAGPGPRGSRRSLVGFS